MLWPIGAEKRQWKRRGLRASELGFHGSLQWSCFLWLIFVEVKMHNYINIHPIYNTELCIYNVTSQHPFISFIHLPSSTDFSAGFTPKNLAEKIHHLSIVFTLICSIDRGHCVTNPKTAPIRGNSPNLQYVFIVWSHQNGPNDNELCKTSPVDKAFAFALSLSVALGSRLSTLAWKRGQVRGLFPQ